MDLKSCISILISADFLKISKLVDETTSFIVYNINDIVRLPIDMSCINDKLLKIITKKLSIVDVDSIIDKKDRL